MKAAFNVTINFNAKNALILTPSSTIKQIPSANVLRKASFLAQKTKIAINARCKIIPNFAKFAMSVSCSIRTESSTMSKYSLAFQTTMEGPCLEGKLTR